MMERILVPLDGSKLAERAISYAGALAQKFDAEITLVRVIRPVAMMSINDNVGFYGAGYGWRPNCGSLFGEQSEADLANLHLASVQRKLLQQGLLVCAAIVEGFPEVDTIIDLARREEIDLIVMSTHGRSGTSRWVHGSVTEQILRCAPCPIFLVRAGETEC